MLEKLYGEHNDNVARSYCDLAKINFKAKKYLEAVDMLENSLVTLSVIGQGKSNLAADSYENLARAIHKLGQIESAIEYGLGALDIRKEVFKADTVEVASSYSKLARIYFFVKSMIKR